MVLRAGVLVVVGVGVARRLAWWWLVLHLRQRQHTDAHVAELNGAGRPHALAAPTPLLLLAAPASMPACRAGPAPAAPSQLQLARLPLLRPVLLLRARQAGHAGVPPTRLAGLRWRGGRGGDKRGRARACVRAQCCGGGRRGAEAGCLGRVGPVSRGYAQRDVQRTRGTLHPAHALLPHRGRRAAGRACGGRAHRCRRHPGPPKWAAPGRAGAVALLALGTGRCSGLCWVVGVGQGHEGGVTGERECAVLRAGGRAAARAPCLASPGAGAAAACATH